MKFSPIFTAAAFASRLASAAKSDFVWERLDVNDTLLLVVDHQVGLFSLVNDFDSVNFHNSIVTHAAIADVFNLPVILTTSAETGPNGPLPREILEMHPNAPIIQRNGEINAWDNEDFRNAVAAANKTQIILGGIVTDVCTAFLALSLREAGYSVWANSEASGTTSTLARELANDQMIHAGVQVVSMFAIIADLLRDWRNPPGTPVMLDWIEKYFPAYGYVGRAHRAAVENGTSSE